LRDPRFFPLLFFPFLIFFGRKPLLWGSVDCCRFLCCRLAQVWYLSFLGRSFLCLFDFSAGSSFQVSRSAFFPCRTPSPCCLDGVFVCARPFLVRKAGGLSYQAVFPFFFSFLRICERAIPFFSPFIYFLIFYFFKGL